MKRNNVLKHTREDYYGWLYIKFILYFIKIYVFDFPGKYDYVFVCYCFNNTSLYEYYNNKVDK